MDRVFGGGAGLAVVITAPAARAFSLLVKNDSGEWQLEQSGYNMYEVPDHKYRLSSRGRGWSVL
jgi:hypothetical protein